MTEQAATTPAAEIKPDAAAPQAQAEIPPAPMMTPAELEGIKINLLTQLEKSYNGFINSVANLPGMQQSKLNAFMFFDTGFIWLQNAIKGLHLVLAAMQPEPQAQQQQPATQEGVPGAGHPVSIPDNVSETKPA